MLSGSAFSSDWGDDCKLCDAQDGDQPPFGAGSRTSVVPIRQERRLIETT